MSSDEVRKKKTEQEAETPLEEFHRVLREIQRFQMDEETIKEDYPEDMSFEFESFLRDIFSERLPLNALDGQTTLRLLLLGVMEYIGAESGVLYSIKENTQLELLFGIGARGELGGDDWKTFFKHMKEMRTKKDLVECSVSMKNSILFPLPTGIGADRQFIFLTGLTDRSVEKGQHLLHSPKFIDACNLIKKQLLFIELLKDSENGLINGNSFFKIASIEFDDAKCTGSSLAIATLYLRTPWDLEERPPRPRNNPANEFLTRIRKILREGEILTIHNPQLFIILMQRTTRKQIEEMSLRLRRMFDENPLCINGEDYPLTPLFGVAYYDGQASIDFSALLMTLSEAFDLCLNTGAQFVFRNAGQDGASTFIVSENASEILFQSLDHNKLLALYRISRIFSRVYELEKLFNHILDLAISAIGAERGLFCTGENGADITVVAARNTGGSIEGEISDISRSIISEAMKNRQPIFSQEVEKDEHLSGRESIISYGIRSVLCMPLSRDDTVHGALYLDIRTANRRFSLQDLIFLTAFSNQAVMAIENAKIYVRKEEEIRKLRNEVAGGTQGIIGQSISIRTILKKIDSIRNSDVTVLIQGDNGAGKELLAKAILSSSDRKEKPFLTIDCSSISDSIIESELFGHVKGAFTGARLDRLGLFEAANGGTIFLDEIDSLNLNVQGKLLRVIEEGEIRRIGENTYRKVDVRVIAATKIDLKTAVKNNEFREDLYYRLNVFIITIPPLRERKEDIPLLANHFLQTFSDKYGKPVKGFTDDAIGYLLRHSWPGNIRELRNIVERSVINAHDDLIRKENLHLKIESDGVRFPDTLTLKEQLSQTRRQAACDALARSGGNITLAAEELEISRRGFQKLLRFYKINNEDYK